MKGKIMDRFAKYDTVRLSAEYNNQTEYTVVETSPEKIVSLFSKCGGFLCTAHEDNLVLVEVKA